MLRGSFVPFDSSHPAPLPDPRERLSQVRHLLRRDAEQLVFRLSTRREAAVQHFSRRRDREALLRCLRTVFDTLRFEDLVVLSPAEQSAALAFYEIVDELAYYFRYTEDMPATLGERLEERFDALSEAYIALKVALDPLPARRDTEADGEQTPPPGGLGESADRGRLLDHAKRALLHTRRLAADAARRLARLRAGSG